MFYAILNEGNTLKNIIQIIKGLFDDLEIEISPNGISIKKMDKSSISLTFIKLSSKDFQEYKCEKKFNIRISFLSFKKVISHMDDEDCLILICADPKKLTIKLEKPEINKISEYEIPLKKHYLYENLMLLDNTTNNAKIILPSKQFEKIINDLNATGLDISIKCYTDGKARFYIEEEIERYIKIKSNHEEEPEKIIKVESDKEIEIRLNIGILTEFSKASLVS